MSKVNFLLLLYMLSFSPNPMESAIGGCGGGCCGCGGGCGGFGFPNLFGSLPTFPNPFAPKGCVVEKEHHHEHKPDPCEVPVCASCSSPCAPLPPPAPAPVAPLPPYPTYPIPTACKKCPEQIYLPTLVSAPVHPEIAPEDASPFSKHISVHKVVETPVGTTDIFKEKEVAARPVPVQIVPTPPTPAVIPAGCPEIPRPGYALPYPQQAYPYTPYGYRPYVATPALPPQPAIPQPLPPVQNCCAGVGCTSGCSKSKNRRALGQKILIDGDLSRNRTCSSERLKKIMLNSYSSSMALAKLEIQQDSELILGPSFHVICSTGDFDYVTRTSIFCQMELQNGFCYAFQT